MGQALYRKYRSKKLSEVIGQEHITTTLMHALKTGKISHAYLFTGPRGVGKTSVARILAHEINQLPYTDDAMHLDIIEIDAASNRRIDEIRDLRDKVNIAPTSAKYKVYIIDEVHMLTKEAFNALLKTLEEPPAHVVFILATTETHKLPETIISRTQRFTFKPISIDKAVEHLRTIAQEEGIDITDEALNLIATHGEGSFRDSISLLDQAGGHDGKIDGDHVRTLLGIPPVESIHALAADLQNHDALAVIASMEQLRTQGFQPTQIAKHLSNVWRNRLLEARTATPLDFALLQKLLDVPSAQDPERYLEIVLLEFTLSGQPAQSPPVAVAKTMQPEQEPVAPVVEKKESKPAANSVKETKTSDQPPSQRSVAAAATPSRPSAHLDETIWPGILSALKKEHNTLYGIVRMATPVFTDDGLELNFSFAFHKKQVSDAKNQKIISDIIKELTGQAISIHCEVVKDKPAVVPAAAELAEASHESTPAIATPKKTDISSISNIFGGAELLES